MDRLEIALYLDRLNLSGSEGKQRRKNYHVRLFPFILLFLRQAFYSIGEATPQSEPRYVQLWNSLIIYLPWIWGLTFSQEKPLGSSNLNMRPCVTLCWVCKIFLLAQDRSIACFFLFFFTLVPFAAHDTFLLANLCWASSRFWILFFQTRTYRLFGTLLYWSHRILGVVDRHSNEREQHRLNPQSWKDKARYRETPESLLWDVIHITTRSRPQLRAWDLGPPTPLYCSGWARRGPKGWTHTPMNSQGELDPRWFTFRSGLCCWCKWDWGAHYDGPGSQPFFRFGGLLACAGYIMQATYMCPCGLVENLLPTWIGVCLFLFGDAGHSHRWAELGLRVFFFFSFLDSQRCN